MVARRPIGIVMNGVTGRMGSNQHLIRSIVALREQGGLALRDGTLLWPEPVLVGRHAGKLQALGERCGIQRFSTDLDACLADPANEIYFDAQITSARPDALRKAIDAGKHVYAEKPISEGLDDALDLARRARQAGVANGVVQDKLFLPGLRKLKRLVDSGFFGRILSVRGEFGYWVFEGDWQPAQRPSWNYRAEDGGGIILDMFAHWRYVLDGLFAPVRSVSCVAATHVPQRFDGDGSAYNATAEDAAYATFQLQGGIVAQVNSSWAVRVNRDELVEFQVDGTHGSAVAGLRRCRFQHRAGTPRAVWNPDLPEVHAYRDQWTEMPDNETFDNGFKVQWEHFLRHVVEGEEFPWDFVEGAKGVQMAELGMQAAREGRRLPVDDLEV